MRVLLSLSNHNGGEALMKTTSRPLSGMKWYCKMQRDFAALPTDAMSR